ncbi:MULTISPECIES: hypothetical protein [unclassified Pseudofrankia]|uniref:hypothetical protein n=1 Tax=unclassified Pseudofrankia TaxID=2994372 RepID=UPI0008D9AD00|nr:MULTISPECIES: hypothetical protein [unclassified Pseudofrankia]MDT3442090.1 hypothetical protein [Pseudofrankia sp. BMG5.37]OHV47262.1 hypothetical protein BCD48_19665 [Pseudofrankia sp. BMG5.36]
MLSVFCFDRLAVTVRDMYFVDPDPAPGQEGPERGVRVELRLVEPQPWRGSIYASQRIVVDTSLLRVDLLESVERGPGSRDRVHHHPTMTDNEPGARVFDRGLTTDPVAWLRQRLADPMALLAAAGVENPAEYEESADELVASLPDVVDAVAASLEKVRAGELALTRTRGT